MRSNRVNYVMVGAFTLVVLVGLVVSVALLTGRTGATHSYFTVLRTVNGIARGTQVLYQGYPVGLVERIAPVREDDLQKYRLDLSILSDWQIPDDSVVTLTTGLLAAVNVNIEGGRSETYVEPGAEIAGRDAVDVFATFSGVAGDVTNIMQTLVRPLLKTLSEQVQSIGDRVNAVLSDENVAHLSRTIANLDGMSADVARLAAELRETRQQAHGLLERVDAVLARNEGNVDQALIDLRYSLDSVARHIDAVNHNLEGTSRNMNEFSREIRANPGLLLGGKPPPDDADGGGR